MSESHIFKAAVKLSSEDRAAYLDRACGADCDLRREVESLLRAHEDPGSFLQSHPARPPATVENPPLTEGPGTVIGPYKLLQQIGEGGMGVVYMAEQQEPVRRKVALKIIKPGMDSRQVIARFEAERQALAMMDHQNIAKVLDAGATESGRPYFVMELVHGVPLTKYCDDRHLTPRQRLELFVPICQAIQHAHQKGIIHRDIKPSNILVTMYDDKPVPKVIDFGVAKAVEQRLTEKTLFTQFGTLVGTFEYMSPEQAEMNAFGVDTRSDVYSLGVLLYELLTGTTPLKRERLREAAYGEIVRLIKEEEPPPPSTRLSTSGAALAGISQQRGSEPEKLTRLVRGELDWIVMRCLEKDRARRYETTNALGRDVERYLHDEPVEAFPPTLSYRLRKFARRNKAILATSGLVAAALVVGIVATTWQAVRATIAEHEAQAAEATAKEALGKLEEEQARTAAALEEARRAGQQTRQALRVLTDGVIERRMGRQPQLTEADRAFLRKVLEHHEKLALIRGDDPESRAARAEGYDRVGDIRAFLGEEDDARSAFERAIALYEQLAADFPAVPEYRASLAATHNELGFLLRDAAKAEQAAAEHRHALALYKQLDEKFPTQPEYRHNLAGSHDSLGNALGRLGKPEEAKAELRQAIELQRQLVDAFPNVPQYRDFLANHHNNLGILLAESGEQGPAETEYRAALALRKKLVADFPDVVHYREYLANHHHNLGSVLAKREERAKAEAEYGEAILVSKQLAALFPAAPGYRYTLADTHAELGNLLLRWGKSAQAEPEYRQSLALLERLTADFPTVTKYQLTLGSTCCNIGHVIRHKGVPADVLPWYDRAIRTLAPLVEREPKLATAREYLRNTYLSRASLLMELRKFADATRDLDRGLELAGNLDQKTLCASHRRRALARMKLDQFPNAIKDWDRAFELDDGPGRAEIRGMRATCWARVDPAKAAAEAEAMLEGNPPPAVLYDAACVYALCAANPKDGAASEAHAARAVALLRQASEQGYFKEPARVTHMKKDTDLDPLRDRADFKKLLAELEANKK